MAAMGDRIRATRVKVITRMVYGDRSHSGRSSVNRTLPGPAGEVALVLARLILATIMFAHGYQKLFINGLGRTTQGFEYMSIPAAIVSAAFVTVVELVGSVLVLAGALITIVAACYMIVMVGAAVFVHIPNGIFAADNGWELVGAIAALLLLLAAAGPGRWSVDHAVRTRQGSDLALDPVPPSAPLPQLTTSVTDSPSSTPTMADVPAPTRSTDPLPFRRRRTEA
jgi:putative oxidoreductase